MLAVLLGDQVNTNLAKMRLLLHNKSRCTDYQQRFREVNIVTIM